MTLALAIAGAVAGTAALLFDVLKYLLDRPRLSLKLHFEQRLGSAPEVGIDVRNRGRQPTTIMTAALRPEGTAEIEQDGVKLGEGHLNFALSETPTVVAAHGGVAQFRVLLSRWPGPVHADVPIRAYVVDSHDRLTWGPAAPILRVFLNGGWKPPDAQPEALVPLPDAPLRPEPVEPSWKLWKDRELRKPSLPPPQAWPPKAP